MCEFACKYEAVLFFLDPNGFYLSIIGIDAPNQGTPEDHDKCMRLGEDWAQRCRNIKDKQSS